MVRSEFSRVLDDVLCRHLKLIQDGSSIDRDADLILLGLDSMSAVDLLLDLEETFGIVIPDHLLTGETFHSVSTLEHTLYNIIK